MNEAALAAGTVQLVQLKTIESEKERVIRGAFQYCRAGIRVMVMGVSAYIVGLVMERFIKEVVDV